MYFDDVKTLDELKAAYRRLAMQHHPDCGGDTATMQAINAEHDRKFEQLKRAYNAERRAEHKPETTETPDKFRAVVEALIGLHGLEIELCGSWLWIGGDTYAHRDALKAAGCQWSRSKHKWYWHHKDDGARWSRGRYTMSDIRLKYGSARVSTKEREALTA